MVFQNHWTYFSLWLLGYLYPILTTNFVRFTDNAINNPTLQPKKLHFFGKIQDWILQFKNRFCIFLLNIFKINQITVHQRTHRIHAHSGVFGSFDPPWSEWSQINQFGKRMQKIRCWNNSWFKSWNLPMKWSVNLNF